VSVMLKHEAKLEELSGGNVPPETGGGNVWWGKCQRGMSRGGNVLHSLRPQAADENALSRSSGRVRFRPGEQARALI
jgi:hypothetical protein